MTSALACFDFGNTHFKYALFKGNDMVEKGNLCKESVYESVKRISEKHTIEKSIISAVADYDERTDDFLKRHTSFHKVGIGTKINFSTAAIADPTQIGADRLAICSAAVEEAKGAAPCYKLAISFGTCITYNFIDIENRFLGGAISPGLSMRYRSMHEHTRLLPALSAKDVLVSPPLIGYDTHSNMHAGVLYGMVDEIDGMIGRYADRYDRLAIYATGGDVDYLLPYIKSKIFADPDLIMKGLRRIAYENV